MKFKYIGQAGFKDLDLCIAGICDPRDELIPDTIIEIPDTETDLIKRVKVNGNYQEVIQRPKMVKKTKKEEKKEDEGDEK